MKNIKQHIIVLGLGMLTFASCETTDLDIQDDPNNLRPEQVDVDLVMNHLQSEAGNLTQSANDATEGLMRMRHFFNANWNGAANNSGPWTDFYTDILPEANLIIEKAAEDPSGDLIFHEAIARVIRAHGAITVVDLYNDVPYSEAGQFSENLNPKLDDASEVYTAAFNDLALAKDILENADGGIGFDDFYYDGNEDKWVTLINTLMFKYYLNLSSSNSGAYTTEMNALISEGLIDSESGDFAWRYSESTAPESRHPDYVDQYAATQVGSYMSNYYMWALNNEKVIKDITTKQDPRTRFYFYRQSLSIPGPEDSPSTQQVLPCLSLNTPTAISSVDPDLPFCIADEENVYWGRDVFNVDGIGPENDIRTTYGLYPIGGRFDDDNGQVIQGAAQAGPRNLDGAGISPILLSSYVYFMRAEAAFMHNTSDDATTMLQAGIEASLVKVFNFGGGIPQNNVTEDDLALYTSEVMAHYATASDKLDVIAKEALIALWGNGYEAYNMYRRTGKPTNLQPGIQPSGDLFPKSFFYPNNSVNGNSSIESQKIDTQTGPFWENNNVTLD